MKDDRVYLEHIQDAIQRILDYTTGGKTAYFADRKTQGLRLLTARRALAKSM